ncbi:Telomerase-binding protein EST1A [Trichoplax sp. H2]|nr:Telomerase-binding protein EST1A [Trichoplax sp. H2]|eukprot:RDD46547.1 Telomerase-binding protein EST1A [Trichoplax sp. H2]
MTTFQDTTSRGMIKLPANSQLNQQTPGKHHANVQKRQQPRVKENWKDTNRGQVTEMDPTSVTTFMDQAYQIEKQLSKLLPRRQTNNSFQSIFRHSENLRKCYMEAILSDIQLAESRNVESALWKHAFYQVIERFRKDERPKFSDDELINQENPTDTRKTALQRIIDDAVSFYLSLIKQIQEKYGIDIEDFLKNSNRIAYIKRKKQKLALVSCHRCYIALGDLARYQEQIQDSCNYGVARRYYLKAQVLLPKNGKVYNQLAVIAIYAVRYSKNPLYKTNNVNLLSLPFILKRQLDSVYYYMRSLLASNPILTARESLPSLFEQARKKAEYYRNKLSNGKKHQKKGNKREHQSIGKYHRYNDDSRQEATANYNNKQFTKTRQETWYSSYEAAEQSKKLDTTDNKEIMLGSPQQLYKLFIADFIHIHGKLFTKINMESFHELSKEIVKELQQLLRSSSKESLVLDDAMVILQVTLINIFSIENCRDTILASDAFSFGNEIFNQLTAWLSETIRSQNDNWQSRITTVLPAIKVWCLWLWCEIDEWTPKLSVTTWKNITDLLNILNSLPLVKPVECDDGKEALLLWEDQHIQGFGPFHNRENFSLLFAIPQPSDEKEYMTAVRRLFLNEFGKSLVSLSSLPINYEDGSFGVNESIHSMPIQEMPSELPVASTDHNSECESDDIIVEGVCSEDSENEADHFNILQDLAITDVQDENFELLKARKDELSNKMAKQQEMQETVKAVVDRQLNLEDIELEVIPKYLVIDTNTLIDRVDLIGNYITQKKFHIVVPLVVINELSGLLKGEDSSSDTSHSSKASEMAKNAMTFIEEHFSIFKSHLTVLTTKGNALRSLNFRSEDTSSNTVHNNDDLILQCCFRYCNDREDLIVRGSRKILRRNVVLITNDRNLRVKAHIRNVPTRDINEFSSWVNCSN